jgi:hypothetical protein
MTGEFEGTGREAIGASSCLDGLRNTMKTSVKTAGAPAEVRTEHLPEYKSRVLPPYQHFSAISCRKNSF